MAIRTAKSSGESFYSSLSSKATSAQKTASAYTDKLNAELYSAGQMSAQDYLTYLSGRLGQTEPDTSAYLTLQNTMNTVNQDYVNDQITQQKEQGVPLNDTITYENQQLATMVPGSAAYITMQDKIQSDEATNMNQSDDAALTGMKQSVASGSATQTDLYNLEVSQFNAKKSSGYYTPDELNTAMSTIADLATTIQSTNQTTSNENTTDAIDTTKGVTGQYMNDINAALNTQDNRNGTINIGAALSYFSDAAVGPQSYLAREASQIGYTLSQDPTNVSPDTSGSSNPELALSLQEQYNTFLTKSPEIGAKIKSLAAQIGYYPQTLSDWMSFLGVGNIDPATESFINQYVQSVVPNSLWGTTTNIDPATESFINQYIQSVVPKSLWGTTTNFNTAIQTGDWTEKTGGGANKAVDINQIERDMAQSPTKDGYVIVGKGGSMQFQNDMTDNDLSYVDQKNNIMDYNKKDYLMITTETLDGAVVHELVPVTSDGKGGYTTDDIIQGEQIQITAADISKYGSVTNAIEKTQGITIQQEGTDPTIKPTLSQTLQGIAKRYNPTQNPSAAGALEVASKVAPRALKATEMAIKAPGDLAKTVGQSVVGGVENAADAIKPLVGTVKYIFNRSADGFPDHVSTEVLRRLVGDDLPGDTTASIITAAKGAKVVQAGEDLVHTNKIVTSSFLSRLLRNMEPKAAKVANDARVEKGLSPIGKLTDAAGDAIGGSFGALQANSDIQSVVASVKRNALAKQGVGSPLAKSNRANTLDGIFNVGMTVGGSTIAGGLLPVAAATAVGTGAEVGAMATAGGLLAASFGLDATGIGAIAGLALGAGVVGYEYYTKKQSADAYQNAQSKQTKELVSSLNLPANSPTKNYIQNYLGYTADKLNSMSPTQVQNLITTGQKITKANTPVEGPPAPPTPKVGATSAPVTPKTPATALKNVPIAATQIPSPVAAVKKAVTKPTTILNTVKGDLTKGVKAVSNFFSNI